jgi:hypothetical protein
VDRGISLADRRSKAFTRLALVRGDLVVCVEPPQVTAIQRQIGLAGAQVTLLRLRSSPRRPWPSDPFGLGDADWTSCLDIIDSAIGRIGAVASAAGLEKR